MGGFAAAVAAAVAVEGNASQALTLWSAAQAIHTAIGNPRRALRVADYNARVEAALSQLDPREQATAVSVGRGMSFVEAVKYALEA